MQLSSHEGARSDSWRRRVFDLLERGRRRDLSARAFGLLMVSLILANVAAAVLQTVPDVAARHGFALILFDRLCVAVFALEYAARLWAAPEHPLFRHASRLGSPASWRWRYAATPIMVVDALAILPFLLELLFPLSTSIVLLRLVRFLKIARYSPALMTIGRVIAAQRQALFACVVLFVGLLLFAAAVMVVVEGQMQPETLGDMPGAMWWSITVLTKLGNPDVAPLTPLGKLVAAVIMLLGIGFFALPVGIIGRGFYDEIRRHDFIVTFGMVARIPLFAALDAATIAELVGMLRARKAPARTVIIRKGEEGDAMFLIVSGAVEVAIDDRKARMSEGDFFGEMALLSQGRRSATVTATRATELLVLDGDDFKRLMARSPELAKRVREVAATRSGAGAERAKDS